jgi:DNA-binding IclR family transcriptional regulator
MRKYAQPKDVCREDEGPYLVPGLERGLRILAEFSPLESLLSAAELAKRLDIPRTTIFRLLQTLEILGFVERVGKDRNYRLGVSVLRLGFDYLSSLELTDVGLPVIQWLRDATGFSAHIVIRDGRDVVFVAKAQSHARTFSSVRVNVGTRMPAHASTHGHVLLGDLSLEELTELYPESQLERFTAATPETVESLFEEIGKHAARGYAVGNSTFEHGLSVVTVPVRNETQKIAACITVLMPRSGMEDDSISNGLVNKARHAATELSRRLSYRNDSSNQYLNTLDLR